MGQAIAADWRAEGALPRDDDEQSLLLRLTQQVAQIANRLELLTGPLTAIDADKVVDLHNAGVTCPTVFDGSGATVAQPSRPDPHVVRGLIRQRRLRSRFLSETLFADPAWDMLLDLTLAQAEQKQVSITSLSLASGVPTTTALRRIGELCDAGLLQRTVDAADRRRVFVTLTPTAEEAMTGYFAAL